ncbi:MAG: chemotaxis protein CheA [Gammaproteobacteria bacterium]
MSIDVSQFLATFYEESFEGLEIMEAELLNLDVGAADSETINTIFRAAHSIKGGSGTFGLNAVADFTHVMETLLDEMRDGRRQVTQEAVNILLSSVDVLREMLTALRDGAQVDAQRVVDTKAQLDALLGDAPCAASTQSPEAEEFVESSFQLWSIEFKPHLDMLRTGNDPVRMFRELSTLGELSADVDLSQLPQWEELDPEEAHLSWKLTLDTDKGEDAIREVFEWVDDECELSIAQVAGLFSKPRAGSVALEAQPAASSAAAATTSEQAKPSARKPTGGGDTSIRVSIDKVDELINMVGELVITQSMLSQYGEADAIDAAGIEKLRDGLGQLERNTRELQESVMRIRMLPISFAFQRFPRLVHDLSGKLGKNIQLKMSGEQTELDKTVMEKIGDPLVHLVRNSLDHGIEQPAVRRAKGKPEQGTVHLNAFHQGGNIVIEIIDDGAGLNKDKIVSKAIERGLLAAGETITDEQAHDLIFHAGFSTADTVSDVSGRGVGMDVVRKNIRSLGGTVEVRSIPDVGSTFTIRLPLTLAILDGQLVKVGDETYIVPLISIIESVQVKMDKVNTVSGKGEVYRLRDEYIPIVRLYHMFGIRPDNVDLTAGLLVVVEAEGEKLALFVDDLFGQQQVVIKSLETNFKKVDGVSGATILGDGTVALILDVKGMVGLYQTQPPAPDLYLVKDNTEAA